MIWIIAFAALVALSLAYGWAMISKPLPPKRKLPISVGMPRGHR